jgi:hypothetical protein
MKTMNIRITVNDSVVDAVLSDTPAAKDFLALLPLSLKLRDYASTEKVSDLPSRLRTAGSPAGYQPSVGDITYYAPWGNLAIFYRSFDYAEGLIKLGKISDGLDILTAQQGEFTATVEFAREK